MSRPCTNRRPQNIHFRLLFQAVVDSEPLVDPTYAEESVGAVVPILTMAYMPAFDEVSTLGCQAFMCIQRSCRHALIAPCVAKVCGLVQVGEIIPEVQEKAIQLCVQRCTQVHAVQEACLLATLSDDVPQTHS